MHGNKLSAFIIFIVLILLAVFASIFVVDERKYALVFQFGEIKKEINQPGLNFKIPLIQNVRFFDKRLLTMDTRVPERFLTKEKKNVLVDHFVKWRIIDPLKYYQGVQGDENAARTRLFQRVNSSLREKFGQRTVHEVVSGERNVIMDEVRREVGPDAEDIGVEIVDVRLKRVELPNEVSESVYQRMDTERKKAANQLRSEGAAEAEKNRAEADRTREIMIAEAYRDAQKIKGEADAKAMTIYAAAFSKDPEFYAFIRSLEAYRQSFSNKGDVIVIDPSSDFFKYFKDSDTKRNRP